MTGFVHVIGTDSGAFAVLKLTTGEEIPLLGANAAAMTQVDSAEVEVRGAWNADRAIEVSDFLVRQVGGAPVMDGVLVELYDEDLGGGPIGYGLRLTRGSMVDLIDPPAELLAHVGARVWVSGPVDGPPTGFGIIHE